MTSSWHEWNGMIKKRMNIQSRHSLTARKCNIYSQSLPDDNKSNRVDFDFIETDLVHHFAFCEVQAKLTAMYSDIRHIRCHQSQWSTALEYCRKGSFIAEAWHFNGKERYCLGSCWDLPKKKTRLCWFSWSILCLLMPRMQQQEPGYNHNWYSLHVYIVWHQMFT